MESIEAIMGAEVLDGADPVARDLWVALAEGHRRARTLLRALYQLPHPEHDRLDAHAADLGVDIIAATRRTPAFLSRDPERQRELSRPVPEYCLRRDFEEATKVHKTLSMILEETGPEALGSWAKPIAPIPNLAAPRGALSDAIRTCEAAMAPYALMVSRREAADRLGGPRP